jgi:bifunctional UDP-N-acetylglucosamine pyrophosphorylase/glucosamine-1-phosphate N-acetyltransferase
MKPPLRVVILAAGKSKRIKSTYSKMVHKILGKEIINILVDAFIESGIPAEDLIIVTGKDDQSIKNAINKNVHFVIQEQQLGTAHALLSAQNKLKDFQGNIIVTVGDNPHICDSDIKQLIDHHQSEKAHCTLLSAVFPKDPPPYGRILRDQKQRVIGVVEEMDARPDQLQIMEVNASVYLFDFQTVHPLLSEINNQNRKNEYYLTDIVGILVKKKLKVNALMADNYWTSIGINNRWELQQAQKRLNERNQKKMALEKGVTILQPETVTIEFGVEIGPDTTIFPCSYIARGTSIGENCQIGPFVFLKNTSIPDNSRISFKKIEYE